MKVATLSSAMLLLLTAADGAPARSLPSPPAPLFPVRGLPYTDENYDARAALLTLIERERIAGVPERTIVARHGFLSTYSSSSRVDYASGSAPQVAPAHSPSPSRWWSLPGHAVRRAAAACCDHALLYRLFAQAGDPDPPLQQLADLQLDTVAMAGERSEAAKREHERKVRAALAQRDTDGRAKVAESSRVIVAQNVQALVQAQVEGFKAERERRLRLRLEAEAEGKRLPRTT
jgi:hypothetical protein